MVLRTPRTSTPSTTVATSIGMDRMRAAGTRSRACTRALVTVEQ
jgi:hypothetical protein